MARIRTIKPEFWTSEQVTECSVVARLLFIGLWNFADDYGVHPASPRRLKMQVFPSDDLTAADVEGMINELVTAELVFRFEAEGAEYLWVTGWERHQKIEKRRHKYPVPPLALADQSLNGHREVADQSSIDRRKVVELPTTAHRTVGDASAMEKEVEAEKDSIPNGMAAPDDPEREMWDRGKSLLEAGGVPAAKSGSIIGKWRKEYGNTAVMAAIAVAENECVSDPVAFVMACLVANSKKRSRGPPKADGGYVPMHPGAGG